MENKKLVYSTPFEHKAILIYDALLEQGIQSVRLHQMDSMYKSFGEFEIYVPFDKVEAANEIIKKLDE